MKDCRAILFPHSHLPGLLVNKISTLFEGISICQPWFMDSPLPETQGEDLSSVHIIRPSLSLKPKEDFKRLLSEYRTWMRHHRGGGTTANQAASNEMSLSNERAWKIRQLILGTGKNERAIVENNALKWHLILHLAREFEETQAEAEEILSRVRQGKSPLEGALEEEASLKGLFDDLPPSGRDAFLDEAHFHQVVEAWFGLFSQHLQDHEALLTFDQSAVTFVSEIFEDEATDVSDPLFKRDQITAKRLPRLLNDKKPQHDPVKSVLSGKTIILFRAV